MDYKLGCLCGCGFVAEAESKTEVATSVRNHLREAHKMPADPAELAEFALPAYDGVAWAHSKT
jgi:hypothetical protein